MISDLADRGVCFMDGLDDTRGSTVLEVQRLFACLSYER